MSGRPAFLSAHSLASDQKLKRKSVAEKTNGETEEKLEQKASKRQTVETIPNNLLL